MFKFADLVEKHGEELAALETWNNGKLFRQAAKDEIPMFVRLFRYYAGMNTGNCNTLHLYCYICSLEVELILNWVKISGWNTRLAKSAEVVSYWVWVTLGYCRQLVE